MSRSAGVGASPAPLGEPRVAAGVLPDGAVEPARDEVADPLLGPLAALGGEPAGLLHERPVPGDRLVEIDDPLALDGDGPDDGRGPPALFLGLEPDRGAERDAGRYESSMATLRSAVRSGENLMEPVLDCVRAYATVGEIVELMKEEYGTWREPEIF